jgi:hypothetical protein
MCLRESYKKEKNLFCYLKVTEERSRIRIGSISQRYGSADPDSHQNLKDPQHCFLVTTNQYRYI